jgi:hypothetical protein
VIWRKAKSPVTMAAGGIVQRKTHHGNDKMDANPSTKLSTANELSARYGASAASTELKEGDVVDIDSYLADLRNGIRNDAVQS